MLILQRQVSEEIIIGEGPAAITVCVVDILGDKVRIGVTADRATSVHRKEVYERIRGSTPLTTGHGAGSVEP